MRPNPATNYNTGSCPKGKNCPYQHICQNCTGKNFRITCLKYKAKQITPTPDHSTVTMSRNPSLQLNEYNAVTTPIKVDQLAKYLRGYDASLYHFLSQGFKFDLKIPFQGKRQFRLSKNLPSLKGKEDILKAKIQTEIQANREAGPVVSPPFKNLQVSPLGLVPKKQPNEYRLIHHHSKYLTTDGRFWSTVVLYLNILIYRIMKSGASDPT